MSICGGQNEKPGPAKAAPEAAPVLVETENILVCQPKSSSEKGGEMPVSIHHLQASSTLLSELGPIVMPTLCHWSWDL